MDSCRGKFIALVGEGWKMCPVAWGSRKLPRPARSALAAEAQAAADAMGEGEAIRLQSEEMSGMDEETARLSEETARLSLVTDSKSPQEARHTDNQPKDKRTAIDMAVLRRSVDMNTKQGACCDKSRQALISGRVDFGL